MIYFNCEKIDRICIVCRKMQGLCDVLNSYHLRKITQMQQKHDNLKDIYIYQRHDIYLLY